MLERHAHVSARGHGHQFFLAGYFIEAGTYPMADDHGAGTFYGELAMDVALLHIEDRRFDVPNNLPPPVD